MPCWFASSTKSLTVVTSIEVMMTAGLSAIAWLSAAVHLWAATFAVDHRHVPFDRFGRLLDLLAPFPRERILGVGRDVDDFRAGRRLRPFGWAKPFGLQDRPLFGRLDRRLDDRVGRRATRARDRPAAGVALCATVVRVSPLPTPTSDSMTMATSAAARAARLAPRPIRDGVREPISSRAMNRSLLPVSLRAVQPIVTTRRIDRPRSPAARPKTADRPTWPRSTECPRAG